MSQSNTTPRQLRTVRQSLKPSDFAVDYGTATTLRAQTFYQSATSLALSPKVRLAVKTEVDRGATATLVPICRHL